MKKQTTTAHISCGPHSPQGFGAWATAAASSRLRQDSTLMRFMLRSFGRRPRMVREHSVLREWRTSSIYTCPRPSHPRHVERPPPLLHWGEVGQHSFGKVPKVYKHVQAQNRSDIMEIICVSFGMRMTICVFDSAGESRSFSAELHIKSTRVSTAPAFWLQL